MGVMIDLIINHLKYGNIEDALPYIDKLTARKLADLVGLLKKEGIMQRLEDLLEGVK